MLRAALELSARGVFDASEITPLKTVSTAGKLDEMLLEFPKDGIFKGCSFIKRDKGFIVAYEDEDNLYVEPFDIDTDITRGMLHLYLSDKEIICELFAGSKKETTRAKRSRQDGDDGQSVHSSPTKKNSFSVRKFIDRRRSGSNQVDRKERSPGRRYSLRHRNK